MNPKASETTVAVCEKCRRIRLATVTVQLISAVLAGYFLSSYEQLNISGAAWLSALFAMLSLLLVLAVEFVVTKVEIQSKRLMLEVNDKTEEVRLLKEKNRDLERTMTLVVEDDDELRQKLLSMSIHRAAEEEARAQQEPANLAPSLPKA